MSSPDDLMFQRIQGRKLKALVGSFPVVSLIGPRQSGKTTLARSVLPDYNYVSLEDMDNRAYAENDPRGFLKQYNHHTIIDEAQRAPDLFSYMQTKVDELDTPGQYVLTSSAHMTSLEKLTQSLAGRAALLKLLPLSLSELISADKLNPNCAEQLYAGFYPIILGFISMSWTRWIGILIIFKRTLRKTFAKLLM